MIDWVDALIGALIGVLLGSGVIALITSRRRNRDRDELTELRTRARILQTRESELVASLDEGRRRLAEVDESREAAERGLAAQGERLRSYEEAEIRLKETFRAAGAEALAANNQQFLELARRAFQTLMAEARGDVDRKQQAIDEMVKPIRELLERQNRAVAEIETKREGAYAELAERVRTMTETHRELHKETGRLVTALYRPKTRGDWGEFQLRNVVELAGMTRYCDFDEQVSTDDPESRQRPDMTIRLPGGGVIVVDSKVALDSYLAATTDSRTDRDVQMEQHARAMERHVVELSKRGYNEAFEKSPGFVVMFVRLESALVAAMEAKPDLIERAMQRNVLVVTPVLLLALLHSVAYGWRQENVAANAREIAEVGGELYDRLDTFIRHLDTLGQQLGRSTESFNQAVGSLKARVLPSTRKLKQLHATSQQEEIKAPSLVEVDPRRISSDELKVGESNT